MKKHISIFLLLSIVLSYAVDSYAQSGDNFAYYRLGVKYKNEKKYDKAIESFRKVLSVYPDNFNSYYQIALIRLDQKKIKLAAYELKKALEYKKDWPEAQYLLAKCFTQIPNNEKALVEWRRYTQITKDDDKKAEAENNIKKLMVILRKKEGLGTTITTPEKKLAVTTSKKTEKKLKNTTVSQKTTGNLYEDKNYKKGLKLYNNKQYDQALKFFVKAIKKYPNHPGAYYYAGAIRYNQKKYKMAEINFKKSYSFPEFGFNSHFYLGLIFEKTNKIDPAINHFKEYVKLTKSTSGKREALLHINKLLKKAKYVTIKETNNRRDTYNREDTYSKKTLPLKPVVYSIDDLLSFTIEDTTIGDGRLMMNAVNLFRSGKYEEALRTFKTVLLRSPQGILADDAIYNIGICYMKLKLYDNAQNQFNQLSTTHPNSKLIPRAEYIKGIAELEKDEYATAEKIFRKWIRSSYPKKGLLAHAYGRLGDALVKQDKIKDGIDAYKASLPFLKTGKSKLPVLFAIGENYENLGNESKASSYYEKVINIGSKIGLSTYVHDSYLKMGDYLYRNKKYDKSKYYYDKFMGTYLESKDIPWAKFQIGNIYRNKNLLDSAVIAYKNLIIEYPESYWTEQAKWKLDDTIWQNEYGEILQ